MLITEFLFDERAAMLRTVQELGNVRVLLGVNGAVRGAERVFLELVAGERSGLRAGPRAGPRAAGPTERPSAPRRRRGQEEET